MNNVVFVNCTILLLSSQVHRLYTYPDNIHVDPSTGDLWVGCIPKMHPMMKYLDNPKDEISSAQVCTSLVL